MRTKIQKWDNSLAIRIPKVLADKAGLINGIDIELQILDEVIYIKAVPEYDLDALLADVTPDNLHGEIDIGSIISDSE